MRFECDGVTLEVSRRLVDSIRAEVQAMDAYLKAVLENSSWDEQTKLRDSFTVLRKKSDEELKKLRAAIVGELM